MHCEGIDAALMAIEFELRGKTSGEALCMFVVLPDSNRAVRARRDDMGGRDKLGRF